MQARMINLHHGTYRKLFDLKKLAEQDGEYRVAKRIHAILLNHDGNTSGSIANILHAPRSKVSEWLQKYSKHGYESLLEGQRSGRPSGLDKSQIQNLSDIIESGPVAYGYLSGIWTSIMISEVIQHEFSVTYHPGHVRKILRQIGFSVQRPRRQLIKADPEKQNKWRRYVYPNIKKKLRI